MKHLHMSACTERKKKKPDNTLAVHFITLKLKLAPKINIHSFFLFFQPEEKSLSLSRLVFGPSAAITRGQ